MDRLENIFLNPDERVRERNLEMFRDKIYDALIIKRENFPESYFELQKRIAREHGNTIEEIPAQIREQMIDTATEDQRASLDAWIDYLASDEAVYPAWFKYFVWKNITKLSQFDKERGEFKKRTDTTVAPFPDIYSEPLARILDLYEQVKEDNKKLKDPEIQAMFSKSFPFLYAELTQKSLEESLENRESIRGEWITYKQGNNTDARRLYDSLQNKGTGWCVAGLSTAQGYIKNGNFHIYYSYDNENAPTNPRLAIAMNGNRITELRGLLPGQTPEPQLQEVIDGKLKEFGHEADTFRKTSADMKRMTELHNRAFRKDPETGEETYLNPELSKEELVFLYEIDNAIKSFGRGRDPRIEQIKNQRNPEEDMLVIFECTREEIAHVPKEINDDTKAYIGEWNPTIFQTIKQYPNIKHLYESFPDKKIFMRHMETDPAVNSPKKAEESLKAKNIHLSEWGKDILYKTEFSTKGKNYELVQFTVEQLGLPAGATTDDIYAKADELGLNLSPAEVGPHLRLQYGGGDWKLIAMKQVTDRGGHPDVFYLYADGAALKLDALIAKPSRGWDADDRFVFCSRKES